MNALDIASWILLLGIGILAVAMDLVCMRVSNRLIFAGLIIGWVVRWTQGGWMEIVPFLWNVSFPVITLYLFYLSGILGAADIKLFSVIGGFVQFQQLILCMVAAFVIGAGISLAVLIHRRMLWQRLYKGMRYFCLLLQGKWEPYQEEYAQAENVIHFTIPMFLGLMWIFFCSWSQ